MNEIEILLQKYYDGLTTSAEESELLEYFLSLPEGTGYEAERLQFLGISSLRDDEIPVPENLEADVLLALDRERAGKKPGGRRIVYMVLSVAAAVVLMISTVVLVNRNSGSSFVTDPDVAYAESRQALEMVSRYFNQGTAHLSGLNRINQAMEPLDKLNSLDKAAKSLSQMGKVTNQK